MRLLISLFSFIFLTSFSRADIIIGVAGPLSGTNAQFGEQMVHGAQLAVDDINSKGGIAGERLLLQPEDDDCDTRKAEVVAQDLIAKKAAVVIGHFCSNPALSAARIYESAGIPLLAPSASLPALTEAGLWNVVRLVSRDDAQGDVAAARIAQDYPTGVVAVLSDGVAANAGLARRFTSNLGKAPALALTFKPDAPDFAALFAQLSASKIDVIYFACGAADAGRIAAGLTLKTALFGPDALLDDLYWAKSGEAGEGTSATFATDPQAALEARSILRGMRATGYDSAGAALPSYAAVQLFAAAAARTSPKNGKAIVSYLRSGQTFETALGNLSFDKKGDVQPLRFIWYQWHNGSYSASSN